MFDVSPQVKRVVVYLGRDKTMQLLEELMSELELTDPVNSAVTHMDNPPYYRITSSYKIDQEPLKYLHRHVLLLLCQAIEKRDTLFSAQSSL